MSIHLKEQSEQNFTGFKYGSKEIERLAELVQSAPFVQNVLDAMPSMVAVMTSTRQIVAANKAMLIFLEIEPGEFTPGERPGELLCCVNRELSSDGCGHSKYCSQCGAFHTIVTSMASGEPAQGECRLTFEKNGEKVSLDLEIHCAPFEVEGQKFSIMTGVDISDRKRRQALEEVFFHDILNGVSVLLGGLELLRTEHTLPDQGLVHTLHGAANTLIEEIAAQRDLMRAEKDELNVIPRLIRPRELLEDLICLFGNWQGSARRLVLAGSCQDTEIRIDPILLKRVLSNMVKNALEASMIDEPVELGCRNLGENVEFWVHNRSVMPEDVQLKVFQRSFSTKGAGRGQGTYSMRLLSERYLQGSVNFHSSPKDGTWFYATYPKSPPDNPSDPKPE